jgi:hypothetical protein
MLLQEGPDGFEEEGEEGEEQDEIDYGYIFVEALGGRGVPVFVNLAC